MDNPVDNGGGTDDGKDDYSPWHPAPFPLSDWEVNNSRLHGIPDYSNFWGDVASFDEQP